MRGPYLAECNVPCGRVPSVSCWVCSSLVSQGSCIDLPASHSAEVVTERAFSVRNVCYIYEGSLPISWISSRGQSTRGDPPASELGEGLTTRHKNQHVTKCDTGSQTDGFCGTTKRQEGRDGRCMWHVSGRKVTHTGFWGGNLKERTTRKT